MKTQLILKTVPILVGMIAAMVLCAPGAQAATRFQPVELRCEYAASPVALDVTQPRFSWVVQTGAGERGVLQSSYQILAASSLELLKKNQGDLWDSGKVTSGQSTQVEYAGRDLKSGETYFWKVRFWNQANQASPWSAPARWTMGMLRPTDWRACWIGLDAATAESSPEALLMSQLLKLDDCHWVWAGGSTAGNQPAGQVYFRKIIQLPADRKIQQATFLLTADDSFTLFVNGHPSGQGTSWKNLVSVDVTGRLQSGENALGILAINAGDNASPAGLMGKLVILFSSGESRVLAIDGSWQSSRTAGERWSWPDFDASSWASASAIAPFGSQPWGKLTLNADRIEPAPYFRKSFSVSKPVKRAMLFASALGVYEFHLNGQPVDHDVLSPGWTDYRKRVHYFGYDVTRQVRQGANALGAILGDGWYAGHLAFTGKRNYYGDKTRLLAQLQLEYQDGSREILGTDGTWKAAFGPIREGDMLMGCVYDARLEMPGWNTPQFDEAAWRPAQVDSSVKVNLEAHPGAPIRRIQELRTRKITEPKPGVFVFDLGQNMVGWVRLKAKGQAGQKVVVRHAEMLNPDGTIYTTNLRAAKATDVFYLAGGAKRAYEPYFTFHGFQYVEVTGLDYRPSLEDITGIVVHSDLPQAGWFECSEPLVNKLALNSLWGQKGNFLDVPTDCPQRDERAGWTGDAQVFMKTACLNLDAPGFYTKWLIDLCQDSQREDGGFGDVAPHLGIVSHGNTGWSDAGPVCNWQMHQLYGDTRALRQHYPSLVRHMEYLAKTSKDLVRGTGAYGDWLRLAGPQHSEVIGTAYYFNAARLMSEMATTLGLPQDAANYRQLMDEIRGVFVKNFIKDDGRIIDGKQETGQTFYALAFGLDLVPSEKKADVARQFLAELKKQDDHLATGFLGTPFVLFALQKAGHPEMAYKLVLNKTYPSWLQQVIWGSTTMWERWDGWRPDKGFQDPGMNSFNHYWLGCVSEWLFTQAAGLDTDGPGFQRIRIRPEIVSPEAGFNWVKASYKSIRGRVASAWKLNQNQFELTVTVPGNCTATVYVPATSTATITESGKPAIQAKGVTFIRQERNAAVFEIGSGQYTFRSKR
ncbi:MAG TPA: family 78 glycoside hydrolase catalytic domain [Verrucomicrobiota bacterium]|nr:family 78 glycoside hydrolase catalytic domain [Verrucomicrobiota bacterium]